MTGDELNKEISEYDEYDDGEEENYYLQAYRNNSVTSVLIRFPPSSRGFAAWMLHSIPHVRPLLSAESVFTQESIPQSLLFVSEGRAISFYIESRERFWVEVSLVDTIRQMASDLRSYLEESAASGANIGPWMRFCGLVWSVAREGVRNRPRIWKELTSRSADPRKAYQLLDEILEEVVDIIELADVHANLRRITGHTNQVKLAKLFHLSTTEAIGIIRSARPSTPVL